MPWRTVMYSLNCIPSQPPLGTSLFVPPGFLQVPSLSSAQTQVASSSAQSFLVIFAISDPHPPRVTSENQHAFDDTTSVFNCLGAMARGALSAAMGAVATFDACTDVF